VLAHSLGGVVTFDAAVRKKRRLWVKHFVTFGSQSAFFHLMNPRLGLTPYEGSVVKLPPSIGTWTSFWEPMDPLAFTTAPVFVLEDGTTAPVDIPVQVREASELLSSFLWTHSCYWTHQEVIEKIGAILQLPFRSPVKQGRRTRIPPSSGRRQPRTISRRSNT
jgi:hypothetical protein